MNKSLIKEFIIEFDKKFNTSLIEVKDDKTEEFYTSSIFNKYIDYIEQEEHFFVNLKSNLKLLLT
jgi:hypothetical protein